MRKVIRWEFFKRNALGTGLRYVLKGTDEQKMLRHLAAEGITPENRWERV